MTTGFKTLQTALHHLTRRRQVNVLEQELAYAEPPLRAELFSADQMERHGTTLAELHKIQATHGPDKLLARLEKNEDALLAGYEVLREPANGCWIIFS